ncbi:MAG: hypothetical protein QOE52_2019, partial [Mycobacterium sp.]|nr:hypothetical protein [Mycobacterium sp.]
MRVCGLSLAPLGQDLELALAGAFLAAVFLAGAFFAAAFFAG